MGLGILEPRSGDHAPGTTTYFDQPEPVDNPNDDDHHHTHTHTQHLKCDTAGPSPIILVPQPTDSASDPLNWPLWRRDLITLVLSLTAVLAISLASIMAADAVTISGLFSQNFTRVAQLTGYFLLGTGAAAIFFVPSSRIWGKRHAFILGLVLVIAGSAWAGAVRNTYDYGSLVGARIMQGVGCAPWETLVGAAVGDLYHVHQRGARMAFANLAVFGGVFLTPVLAGEISSRLGWWWTFYLVAIFCAAMLPAVVLLCPETAYRRGADGADDSNELPRLVRSEDEMELGQHRQGDMSRPSLTRKEEETQQQQQHQQNRHQQKRQHQQPGSYLRSLALFSPPLDPTPFLKLLLRPLPLLLLHPAVIWACLTQGTMIGWTVFIGVTVAALFQGRPLFWNEVQAGHAYAAAFAGAVAGFLVAAVLADRIARFLTRRNGGVYEPEFRIALVVPMMVLGCAGLYGFGITAGALASGRYHYAVPLAFFGLQVAGMVVGTVASSLYIVDGYRDLAVEAFTCTIVFKNLFCFVLTFYAFDWILAAGEEQVMTAIATAQVVVCLASVPMYVYGKRIRAFSHQYDMLAYMKLR